MDLLLFDFADPRAIDAWTAIDDRVMGGISYSRLRHDPSGHAVFEGEVSLARNGGFASVRCRPGAFRADGLAGATSCLVDLRGDPKQFKLSLFVDDNVNSVSYQAGFTPAGDGWQTVCLPLTAFQPSFRGRELRGAPALDPARICQVGMTIAAQQAGPFTLEVRRIGLA